jgi:hypothetical protein
VLPRGSRSYAPGSRSHGRIEISLRYRAARDRLGPHRRQRAPQSQGCAITTLPATRSTRSTGSITTGDRSQNPATALISHNAESTTPSRPASHGLNTASRHR